MRDRKLRFNNLMHHITPQLLHESYLSLKRKAAPGVDGATWKSYGRQLEVRLRDLHERIQNGRYRAKPSRRIYLPKPDGKQRPIGIAAVEDKIVQHAVVTILNEIYETDFLGFSYGFRPGRNQHKALDALWAAITTGKVNWIVDADIRSFFDSIDHTWLRKMLSKRLGDGRLMRLINQWLRAGVLEKGQWTISETGTPQGAVISPLLANIFMHFVLDLWVQHWRENSARGQVIIVRYADDFVIGFQHYSDARCWLNEARQRAQHFGLELHEDKTRLIEFGRFAEKDRKGRGEGKPQTFDFLGFTHICGKRRKDGRFTVLRHTIAKRMRAKLKETKDEMRKRKHDKLQAQGMWLKQVVRGYFQYHAIPSNSHALECFRAELIRAWHATLRRRSQRARRNMTWTRMKRLVQRFIPQTRILHPYPNRHLLVG